MMILCTPSALSQPSSAASVTQSGLSVSEGLAKLRLWRRHPERFYQHSAPGLSRASRGTNCEEDSEPREKTDQCSEGHIARSGDPGLKPGI